MCCVIAVTVRCSRTTPAQGKHFVMSYEKRVLGPSGVYLGDGDGAETRLPTVGEVTDDLYGV